MPVHCRYVVVCLRKLTIKVRTKKNFTYFEALRRICSYILGSVCFILLTKQALQLCFSNGLRNWPVKKCSNHLSSLTVFYIL